jgi:hypothetical protein
MVSYSTLVRTVELAHRECQPVAFAEMTAAQRRVLTQQLCLDMLEALQSVGLKLDTENLEHSLAIGRTFLIHSLSRGLPPMDADREGVLRLDEQMTTFQASRFSVKAGLTTFDVPVEEDEPDAGLHPNTEAPSANTKQHFIQSWVAMMETPLPEVDPAAPHAAEALDLDLADPSEQTASPEVIDAISDLTLEAADSSDLSDDAGTKKEETDELWRDFDEGAP